MQRVLVLFITLLIPASCSNSSGGEDGRVTRPPGSPEFTRGSVEIDTEGGSVPLDVDVAKTDEQRAFGLMRREFLPENESMLFEFSEDTTSAFTMRSTLIPLSIAFFGAKGEIVKMLDMDPCEQEPCPIYDPGVIYRGAIEVNQGAFERWGVKLGDVVRPIPSE